jgi:ribosomal protein S18 acetylase RimI-like enzyme
MAELPIEVAATRDRELVRSLISGDRWITAHALCDLDDGEFPRTRCFVARRGSEHIALGMEYSGWAPQPLHLYGEPAGVAAILMHGIKPRAAWVPTPIGGDPVLDLQYETEKINPMLRMGVDRAAFTPFVGEAAALVAPLVPADAPSLNRLYQLGFAAWLPPLAVAEGIYRGVHRNGRLVAAAGTHVIGRRERIAVVGNVLTASGFRGAGYARATTSAVTAGLLEFCDEVVLNVRSDNSAAIHAYASLGYSVKAEFEERLVIRRSSISMPRFLRRIFGSA